MIIEQFICIVDPGEGEVEGCNVYLVNITKETYIKYRLTMPKIQI